MHRRFLRLIFVLTAALFLPRLNIADGQNIPPVVFLADLPNPNDFTLFANGGWDGSWYVGYNTCWMQKVSAPPSGEYKRAFLGARLGRMKNFTPNEKIPWDKKAYPGEIYMAVSSSPVWTRAQSYFLTNTDDIPLEPDTENAVEGAGESRWFWTEVPMKLVQTRADNYLALWSPTLKMNSVSSAPILAAGWGNKEMNSWVSHDIKGFPPSDANASVGTPLTVFEPALALKLVPAGAENVPLKTAIVQIGESKPRGRAPAPTVIFSEAEGTSIERSWVEISTDAKKWTRAGRSQWSAPYTFSLKTEEIPIGPDGKTWVRTGVSDQYENIAFSEPVNLFARRKEP